VFLVQNHLLGTFSASQPRAIRQLQLTVSSIEKDR